MHKTIINHLWTILYNTTCMILADVILWCGPVWDNGYVVISKIIKDVKVPDVCLQNMKEVICNLAFRVVGDVQECGNYKDIKFMSHTAEVWEKSWFNTILYFASS